MTEAKDRSGPGERSDRQPVRIRLPGFVHDQDIGLGDAVRQASYAVGIKPCGGCDGRAASLNRWVVFTR